MKYNVTVRKVFDNEKPLKAICSVTLDDEFAVHGIRVIETEKGRYITMPHESYKGTDGTDKFRDVCHPISADVHNALKAAVLDAYTQRLSEQA